MSITKPYRRNVRQFIDGQYSEGGRWGYVTHYKYAQSPEHYVRAFGLIQKDLIELFDYIEPSDQNLNTYSYRIHELLLRTCVEIEANCVAILSENGYVKGSDLNMGDYRKINRTHRLSSYEAKLPIWKGTQIIRTPYSSWQTSGSLSWYRVYNETKHDRHSKFQLATFDNLIDAVCGLIVILSSQFITHDFGPTNYLSMDSSDDMETGIGDYFRIRFPTDWPASDKYDFNWQQIKSDPDPFQNYIY